MKKLLLGTGMSFAMVMGAAAADLPPAPAPVFTKAPPRVASWGGFYAGLNAGYVDPSGSLVDTDATILSTSTFPPNATALALGATSEIGKGGGAFIGGAQAGWNYVASPILLLGVETDIQGSALRENGSVSSLSQVAGGGASAVWQTQITASRSLDYLGTLRGRIGATFTPGWLLYVTGGLAYGGVNSNTTITEGGVTGLPPAATVAGSFSGTRVGYAVGGGAEWKLLSNWSAKLEYLYYDLGSVTYSNGTLAYNMGPTPFPGLEIASIASSSSTRFNGQIFRAGLNYKFDWGGPVATRY